MSIIFSIPHLLICNIFSINCKILLSNLMKSVLTDFRRANRDPSKENWEANGTAPRDPEKLARFKNGFVNLALPLFAFSEPLAARWHSFRGRNWTLWDRIELDNGIASLKNMFEYFKTKYNVEVEVISQDVCMLFASWNSPATIEQRLHLSIEDLVRLVSKKAIESHVRALVLDIDYKKEADEENDELTGMPYVRYQLLPN